MWNFVEKFTKNMAGKKDACREFVYGELRS